MKKHSTEGSLVGIGLGIGSPDNITLRALDALKNLDLLFYPCSSPGGESAALQRCVHLLPESLPREELVFPMLHDRKALEGYWKNAADRVAEEAGSGKRVGFITIGDPLFYSTFGYLLEMLHLKYQNIAVEAIPGITAYQACAALVNLPMVEGRQHLAVVTPPFTDSALDRKLRDFNTVVIMKASSCWKQVRDYLARRQDNTATSSKERSSELQSWYIANCGGEKEIVCRNLEELDNEKTGYMSLIILKW